MPGFKTEGDEGVSQQNLVPDAGLRLLDYPKRVMERLSDSGLGGSPERIHVNSVSDFKTLQSNWQDWHDLYQQVPKSSVFQSYEWNSAWWNAFGEGKSLLILEARAGDRLVGIAPMMVVEGSLPGSRSTYLCLIGGKDSDYQDFLVHPRFSTEVFSSFARWLAANDDRWDHVFFRSVPEWSPLRHWSSPDWDSEGYSTYFKARYKAPTLLFSDPDEIQKLPNKKSLKRHFNYYNREGNLEFENLRTAEEIEPYLESFFSQHQERWNTTDTPSQFNNRASRDFYHELVHQLSSLGQVLFSTVKFDGTPIAYHLGFEHRGCLIWYKPTYNPQFEKHSPGQVLLKFILEYALEIGLKELDFTVGDEPYKYRFANKVRQTYDVHIFKSRRRLLLQKAFDLSKEAIYRSKLSSKLVKKVQRRVRKALLNPKG